MSSLLDLHATLKLGRARTLHLPRVLIEDNRVVLRTRCGINTTGQEFTETFAVPTCDTCIADHEAIAS